MTFDPAERPSRPRSASPRSDSPFEAVDGYLRETGYALDFFGRLELLDLTLDELEAEYDRLPQPEPLSAHPPEVDRSSKS